MVAWYCETKGNAGTTDDYKENVVEDCLKGGIETCYAKRALIAHNEKRARHRGASALELYDAASKFIQEQMMKDDFSG